MKTTISQLLMKRFAFIFAAAITSGCFVPIGCSRHSGGNEESSAPLEEQRSSPVLTVSSTAASDLGIVVVEARRKPFQPTLVLPARLLPSQDREAVVGSLIEGRVHRVLVNAGDRVRKGQELMLVEGLQVGEIKAAFIKAKAQLRYADAAAKRQRLLNEQNIGSDKALLEAEAEYQKALAEFTAEDRKIHSVGLSDSDVERFVDNEGDSAVSHVGGVLPIRSPLQGIVAERNVVPGQPVDARTDAFRVIDTEVLWADGQMHERDLSMEVSGSKATLTLSALPGREFTGTIIFISPAVDPQTRTVTVRAAIANPGGVLKPNMFGELRLGTGRERQALVVPQEAVVRQDDSSFVFVAANDSLFSRRSVSLGSARQGEIEVTAGVAEGEHVVANGAFLLKSELMKDAFGEEE